MIRRWFIRFLRGVVAVLLALTLVACALHISNSGTDDPGAPDEGALRFGTLNVHYIRMRAETGPWSRGDWERRKGPLDLAFKAMGADVIGFQEMESFGGGHESGVNLTLDFLLESNPGYRAAAVGDPAQFPSTQPIFYRRAALSVVDQGWFFFSETPDVIYSRTFNGSFPAFASWAIFRDADGFEFLVINVHFEYSSRSNRLLSAELVVERLAPFIERGLPVVLLGDLNARHGAQTQNILADGAGLTFVQSSGSTYHFNRGLNLFGAIDHIGVTSGGQFAGPAAILRQKFAGEWPTDHYPLVADIVFEP